MKVTLAFAILLTLTFSLILKVDGVSAQTSLCDDLVYDEVGIFSSGLSQIESAANALERQGADVRVIAIQSYFSAGNLDNFADDSLKTCRSWQTIDGGWKNNLVILMITMDERDLGLYYGNQWNKALDDSWPKIASDTIGPRFSDGDFVAGVVNGINAVSEQIDLQLNPPPIAPGPVVVQEPGKPTDFTGLWIVLGAVVGVVAIVVVLFVTVRFVSANRKRRAREEAAQQAAKVAKGAASSNVTALATELTELEPLVEAMISQLSDQDAEGLRALMQDAKSLIGRATDLYNNQGRAAGDPDQESLSENEYNTISTAYSEVNDTASRARAALGSTRQEFQRFRDLQEQIPKDLEAAKVAVETAKSQIETAASEGFKTEGLTERLTKATVDLGEVRTLHGAKSFSGAKRALDTLIPTIEKIGQDTVDLPRTKAKLEAETARLEDRIKETQTGVETARPVFEEISSIFAESCWDPIRGNGTESENRVAAAVDTLATINAQITMDQQEWDAAEKNLGKANTWLDEADSFIRSIHALKENLEQARAAAPAEIEEAQSDIDRANAFIAQNDDDVRESLETDLASCQHILDGAKAELGKKKPDFLVVVRAARKANKTADNILAQARDEYEAAETLRRRAASQIREARSSISKAREYIEDHSRDLGNSAEHSLRAAVSSLSIAERASDPAQVVHYAEQAEREADSAYSHARRDFEKAEEERRRERSRRSESYNSWGSVGSFGKSSVGSGFGSFGGGSIGFGGGSRGGGSIGFGGGSRGGGSVGW